MTTVGYGDVYPTTLFGYCTASLVIIVGLVVTALPVAVIGANFSIYNDFSIKREKKQQQKPTPQERNGALSKTLAS